MKSFILMLQFLTTIPLPFKVNFDQKSFSRGIILAPVIGLIMGGLLTLLFYAARLLGSNILTALLITGLHTWLSGGLHLDGLADSADGLLSRRDREKTLAIMKDSLIGTFGTLALIFCIVAKIILISSIPRDHIFPLILIMPILPRFNIVFAAGISNYAGRDQGPAGHVISSTGAKEILISFIITLGLSIYFLKWSFFIFTAAQTVFLLLLTASVKKRLGGITGDILGAVVELSEVFYLLTAIILIRVECEGLWQNWF